MSYVDVIVPCYRYGRFLRECVQSVLADPADDFRVLIIDDASPDNTARVAAELAREDSRVSVLRHTQNRGHIATYNEGIEWASGKYFLLLSADDYWLPGALRRSGEFMDAHPEVGFTFGKAIVSSESGIKHPTRGEPDRSGTARLLKGSEFIRLIESKRVINIVPSPTAVVRTELQKHVGGYRPELPHSGDLEMWLRLAAHASVGVFNSFQAVYRRHGANMQRGYYDNRWQLPDLEQRKAALDCFAQACAHALPKASQIHARLLRALACDALLVAGDAFGAANMEASQQLSEFALQICPGARMSLESALLAFKRALGVRAWSRLRPIVQWGRPLLRR